MNTPANQSIDEKLDKIIGLSKTNREPDLMHCCGQRGTGIELWADIKQSIKSLLREVELEARKDELSTIQLQYGHYLAQTHRGLSGQWITLTSRIKELDNLLGSK